MIEFLPISSQFEDVLDGANFVIGMPSFGNLGQSALDVIVSTLNAVQAENVKLVGFGETEYLLPMAGYESFSGSDRHLSSPLEFYQLRDTKTIFVFIRSICREGEDSFFSKSVSEFLQNKNYASALLLVGASSDEWDVNAMSKTSPFFSFAAPTDTQAILQKTWRISEPKDAVLINQSNQYFPFGTELAADIFSDLKERVTILGKFSLGGMNHNIEALSLPLFIINELELLGTQKRLEINAVRTPLSWKVINNPHNTDLFPVW